MKLEWHQDAVQFQGTEQNPPLSIIIIIIIVIRNTWRNAMDRKVMIAQTLVRGTQQDFNPAAMADGVKTFLNTVFQRQNMQQRRCDQTSLSGMLWSSIMTDNVSQAVDCF